MFASCTQRLPPVGTPFFCLYHASSYFATEAFKLKSIRERIQSFSSWDQAVRSVFTAYKTASLTRSGFKESYNALKSNVKHLIFFLVSALKERVFSSNQRKVSAVSQYRPRGLYKNLFPAFSKRHQLCRHHFALTHLHAEKSPNVQGGSTPGTSSSFLNLCILSMG